MNIQEAIEDYRLALKGERVSPKTMTLYMKFLEEFAAFVGEKIDVRALSPNHIRKFMDETETRESRYGGHIAISTAHKYYSVIRTFIRWMHNQDYIAECLTNKTKAPRLSHNLPDALTQVEVDRVMEFLSKEDFRDKVIFEFFLDTGCRLAETTQIKLGDLNLEEGYVTVFRKGRKEARVPMGRTLVSHLHTYIVRNRKPKDSSEQALFINRFGQPLKYEGMQMLVRRIFKACEIKGKTGPHKIRHTMATSFLRNGGNVVGLKEIMSHSDIKTTMGYVALLGADVQNMHRAASPLDNLLK